MTPIPVQQHSASLVEALAAAARDAPESGIVEIMNYGRERQGLIPLWAGEGDLPTPRFIVDAATRSLAAGETFYTWQRGIPPLRQALADYHARLYGRLFSADQFFITGSGMQAIQLALAMTTAAGDEVIIPSPSWPNAAGAARVLGASPVYLPMSFGGQGWIFDVDQLARVVSPRSRAVFLVSPSNPTGWTATQEDLSALLTFTRRHGLWVIADETYARFWYGAGERAPSFLDLMDAEDRIVFVNTFSKNWAMTGWRIGWLMVHPSLGQVVENLIQYSTSGVATFMQRASVAAIERGEPFIAHQIARARRGRDIMVSGLTAIGRCRFAIPNGAFYLFFAVEGESDTRRLARHLVDEAAVGVAPGAAFGPGGEGFVRLCFARNGEQLERAVAAMANILSRRGS
jgi:aspartate/methionine/tyrosine aminotransferase